MRLPALFLLAAACSVCWACSPLRLLQPAVPPFDALAEPPFGAAEICVVRPHSLGYSLTLPVRDAGVLVGATRGPSYFCYRAEPGPHRLVSGDRAIVIDAASGHRQFVHQSAFPQSFAPVDDTTGRVMLARCGYTLLVEAPNDEDVVTDPERILPARR